MADRALLRAAHLLDVVEGTWLADRRVLVDRDGRVEAVLGPADGDGPADARPVDLGDTWVVPGLIDCHSHLVGELEYSGVPATTTSAAEEAMTGVRNARATLAAGFTSVRDVGTFRAFVDVALRDAIEAGWTPGPRMQCAGAYVTAPGGAGDVTGLARDVVLPADLRFGVVRTPAEVREAVRAIVGGGADLIKILVTGAVLTRGTTLGAIELDRPMIEAAVDQATALGVFVAAHAHGAEGIKLAIRGGVRSIEHGSLIDDDGIELLVRHGTYLVADVYCGDWIAEEGARSGWPSDTMAKNELTTQAQRDGFTKAVQAGVRLAFGTDSGVYPHGRNAIQFGYQVRLGQTPLDAIRSATAWAADCLGWEDRVGSIAPGRFADLVALPGDPLGDIEVLRRPSGVVQGGLVVA
ncbi:MAG TPA: amidohydrolase family protein [Candidatus Saccharimonadales bacterium]|nr:amidohydrolase family protein [Candidatus Saccharimonadales bacterium]